MEFISRSMLAAMKKGTVLSVVALWLLSGTASATNWLYLQRQEGSRYGAASEYFDADSVVEGDTRMVYWLLWVLDEKLTNDNVKKIMWKQEVALSTPVKYGNLEMFGFDSKDTEIHHSLLSMNLSPAKPEMVARVREYGRLGKPEEVVKPFNIETTGRLWQKSVENPDCILYWDAHSTVAWPRDNPKTVEITIKWLWNESGQKERQAFLQSQNRLGYKYEGLKYTVVNYQFLRFENKMKILSITDFRDDNTRINFLSSVEWREIEPGSIDETARKIALAWIDGRK